MTSWPRCAAIAPGGDVAHLVPSLTKEERVRFADWLDWEAHTDEGLIEQMLGIKVPEAVIKNRRTEVLAHRIVSAKLRSIQEESIG